MLAPPSGFGVRHIACPTTGDVHSNWDFDVSADHHPLGGPASSVRHSGRPAPIPSGINALTYPNDVHVMAARRERWRSWRGRMLKPTDRELKYSDVTPKRLYTGRRDFLLGLVAATGVAGCGDQSENSASESSTGRVGSKLNGVVEGPTAPVTPKLHLVTSPITTTSTNSEPGRAILRITPRTS